MRDEKREDRSRRRAEVLTAREALALIERGRRVDEAESAGEREGSAPPKGGSEDRRRERAA